MHTAARQSCVAEIPEQSRSGPRRREEGAPVPPLGKAKAPVRTSPEKIHVVIAAENRLLSEALVRMLGKLECLDIRRADWTAPNGIKELSQGEASVLLLSSNGNLANDLEAIEQARAAAPNVRILLIGMNGDEKEFLQCVRAGVKGYLPHEASGEEMTRAIYAVAAGEAVCRGALCELLFRYFERETSILPNAAVRRSLGLTRREQQLIPLIAEGLTNKEIANRFSLSEQTVKNHLYRMKHKIGAGDRLDIAQVYRLHGFLV
jgi:DNA-binding NarL/FixJ family response regulator